MKKIFALLTLSLIAGNYLSQAQTSLYWDANGATTGLGGTGNWTTTGANWATNNSSGTASVGSGAWTSGNGNIAVFAGTAGTVSLSSGTVTGGKVQVDTTGYTLMNSSTGTTSANRYVRATNGGFFLGNNVNLNISSGITTNGAITGFQGPFTNSVGTTGASLTVTGATLNADSSVRIGFDGSETDIWVPLTIATTGSGYASLKNVGGTNSIYGTVTVNSGSKLTFGASSSSRRINVRGNLTTVNSDLTIGDGSGDVGMVVLYGNNTIGGNVLLKFGQLGFGTNTAFGSSTVVISDGTSFGQQGAIGSTEADRTIANKISLLGNATFGLGSYSSYISGNVDLNGAVRTVTLGNSTYFNGAVTNGGINLTSSSPTRTLYLNGDNTYASGTTQNGGIISLGHDNGLGSAALNVSSNAVGNTLTATDGRSIGNPITLATGANLNMDSGSTNTPSAVWTQVGIISGAGSVTKTGVGTLRLTGNNSYGLGTAVANGSLVVVKPNVTATITSNSITLVFTNGTAVGNYPVLPGVLNGTYPAATFSGLDDYKKATFSASTGVASVVAKTSQTISFSSLPVKSPSDAPFNAGASASSSLPVSYVSSNPGVATVSGSGLITIMGSGTTVITASQAGNADVAPATSVAQVLTVLASADKTTISQDFQVTDPTIPLSQQGPGWSSNDPNFRPDGFVTDSVNGGNLLGMVGGFNVSPANKTTELTYRFAPGNSGLLVFEWTQNISRSTSSFPGDDTFGWKFVQGNDAAFSVRFNNNSSTGRDLLVQGYDADGNALNAAAGQINNWFIDRDDANQFRVTANTISQKWSLDVYNKATSSWYNLISNASMAGTITSLDGMVATWTVTDETFDGTQYTGAGDNFMAFDSLSIQGKQNVLISLNLPLTNPSYDGLPQSVSPSTTPSGLALVVKYNGSTNAPTNAGIYTVTADLVDTTQYVVSAPASGSLIIEKAVPMITAAPTATGITYGQTLADSILSGGTASVPGTFDFTSPSDGPNAGTANQEVTFTPTDSSNYSTTTEMVSVTVAKATPTLNSLPNASGITYGQTLADSILSGGAASVPGTFDFTSPSDSPNAGTASQGITFTPDDHDNFNLVTDSVDVAVDKATPVITAAPSASDINAGQALSDSMLSGGSATGVGGAIIDGTFDFTSPSTVPSVGTANQAVTFSPTDTGNYNTATGYVMVTVIQTTTPAEDYLSGYGLSGADAALTADPDGDGLTNAAEFAFGTSPVSSDGSPVNVSDAAGSLTITFLGRTTGVDYVVKTTSDLSAGFSGTSAPTASSPQPSGLPAGYTQYEASVDTTSGERNFLKVDATLQ